MPTSHASAALSEENLKAHDREITKSTHQSVVKSTTSHSHHSTARPPSKPPSKAPTKAPSKASSHKAKSQLEVTVIEEEVEDLPPKAPSTVKSHHSGKSKKEILRMPAFVPAPPLFEVQKVPEMALVRVSAPAPPAPPAAPSVHGSAKSVASKRSSGSGSGKGEGGKGRGELVDVYVQETVRVTKRSYRVRLPEDRVEDLVLRRR